jgi:FKBP-type peptidyl-prolyl cis-trans isomerase
MRQKTIAIISFFVVLLAVSCSKYPNYTKTSSGILYKLHRFGDSIAKPKAGNYITVDIDYKTANDSLFFKGTRTFQLTKPDFEGAIDECFLMMSAGDSASFVIDASNFFSKTLQTGMPTFISKGEDLMLDIKMLEIRTAAQYQKDKEEFLKWIEDFGEYEKLVLGRFIKEQEIDVEPTASGLYFLSLEQGNGKPVELGDMVTVHFEGRFLNGKFFDSTKKRNQVFEFVYGTELQVIPGLEEAIGRMREGEKALVILPSGLAWGDKGSSTGIIPPFTSVVYELDLVKAKSRVDEQQALQSNGAEANK